MYIYIYKYQYLLMYDNKCIECWINSVYHPPPPRYKQQWYVKCDEMVSRAREVVDNGQLQIPQQYLAQWHEWLKNTGFLSHYVCVCLCVCVCVFVCVCVYNIYYNNLVQYYIILMNNNIE